MRAGALIVPSRSSGLPLTEDFAAGRATSDLSGVNARVGTPVTSDFAADLQVGGAVDCGDVRLAPLGAVER